MSINNSKNNLNRLILKKFMAKQLCIHITFSNRFVVKMFKEPKPKPLFAEVLLPEIHFLGSCCQNVLEFFLSWLCDLFNCCLNDFDFLLWFKVIVAKEYP
jgi:hypothetical protein